ncbi:MAG: YgiQ family radical SAM protein [Planctomycetes bacterium]|nr:YgiQ family radical SAM protein [Planctomycetota bacterium]MCL4729338.1 YgiQ family radical SAM protein [Planctomycetota bacterium]
MSNTPGAKLHAHLQPAAGDHSADRYRKRPGEILDRLERGGHADPEDLRAGRITPDGHAVPFGKQKLQAEINKRWLSEEHQRVQAARGNPVAYGQQSPDLNDALQRFLRTQGARGNAAEGDLGAKAAAAQEYAAKLAAEYYKSAVSSQPSAATTKAEVAVAADSRLPTADDPRSAYLPTTRADMQARGWDQCDFVLVTGDAYVDHPSFANAVIGRVLEWAGFKVGILAQPDFRNPEAFRALGKPRLAFLVSAGNLDSNLNAYTAHKLPRSDDPYSPGGKPGRRPVRATIVYCNMLRRAFGKTPIIVGGIEASQRRFAHYDYWDDKVRRSVLLDSNADMLVFGMGEQQIVEIAHRLNAGESLHEINDVRGTCYVKKDITFLDTPAFVDRFGRPVSTLDYESLLPPKNEPAVTAGSGLPTSDLPLSRVQEFQTTGPDQIPAYRKNYARAFKIIFDQQDPVRGRPVVQRHGALHVVQLPPARHQSEQELDRWYDLPYTRLPHPDYARQGVPAWLTTQHSIITHRGCMGSCTFCAIWMHQGRTIQSRSIDSIEREAAGITRMPGFKGYISDVGGPTANMYGNYCTVQQTLGACKDRDCLLPDPCPALRQHLEKQLEMLRRVRAVPGVKKAFIASGIRHDMLIDAKTAGPQGERYIENLAAHHTSGHLKVAPEHLSDNVLAKMRKPGLHKYEEFKQRFIEASRRVGKEQYLVAYFVSSHPGCTMDEQIRLAEYFKRNNWSPEQVQDFIPTPMTPATAMFYSGLDPETGEYVYTPTTMREKRRQRALMQFGRPEFQGRVRKALREAGRTDLIGRHPGALVPPGNEEDWEDDNPARPAGIGSGPATMKKHNNPYRGKRPRR